jgi:hypothetical protein
MVYDMMNNISKIHFQIYTIDLEIYLLQYIDQQFVKAYHPSGATINEE